MTHDPLHNVEGLSGALYDGSLGPCRLCEFAARVRADEQKRAVEIVDNTINDSGDRADAKDWIKGNRPDWATEGPL